MVKERTWDGEWEQERESASLGASLWGRGLSPGLGSVFYTNAIPKLIKLDLRAVTG